MSEIISYQLGAVVNTINGSSGDVTSIAVTNATNTFTSSQAVTTNPGANTSADALVLQNTTAATSGNQQYSGRLRWTGRCWETTGPSSQTVDCVAELRPVQGTTSSSNLVFNFQQNAGGYSTKATLTSGGNFTITGDLIGVHLLPSSYLEFQSGVFLNFAPNGSYTDCFNMALHSGAMAGVVCLNRVVAKTSNYTLTNNETNLLLTNTGAAGAVSFTLLTSAAVGTTYKFYVNVAQNLVVTAPASNTIRLGASVSSSGGTFTSNTIGNSLEIVCIAANTWVVLNHEGTWTIA